MDFVPGTPVLEVDEAHPSWRGSKGTGRESAIEEADSEVLLPGVASEEDEPTLMHTIVNEELRPPVAKVAHPLAVVVNLDAVCGWPPRHSRSLV
jgi:hypothetical protein